MCAKSTDLETENRRVPFGINSLDRTYGGIPEGSLVLLKGETDSGALAFSYTTASMLSLAKQNPDLFYKYVGTEVGDRKIPDDIHYVSLTRRRKTVLNEVKSVVNKPMYDSFARTVEFTNFSHIYLKDIPLPQSLLNGNAGYSKTEDKEGLLDRVISGPQNEDLLAELSDYFDQNLDNSLVILDSLTELIEATNFELTWEDVFGFLVALRKRSRDSDGLIYLLFNRAPHSYDEIASIPDGVINFETEESGLEFRRTLHVGSFRGLMTEETPRKYETVVKKTGFEVSNVRRIL
ncbi:MAG: hypothetical protein SV377_03140 [Halobacteria archaeon]|nr:hypothetical protein [Halobacteria archaeon]